MAGISRTDPLGGDGRRMKRIVFRRRSRRFPGLWLPRETVVLPDEGARLFIRDARHSRSHKILKVVDAYAR